MLVHETEPYNAEPPRPALAQDRLTPEDTFYARNHGPVPHIDPTAWRLRVRGQIARPLDLSLQQLRTEFAAQVRRQMWNGFFTFTPARLKIRAMSNPRPS